MVIIMGYTEGKACAFFGGYVKKQNYWIWVSKNPYLIVERPLHPSKMIGVHCSLVVSETHISSKTKRETTLPLIFGLKCKISIWSISSFNKMELEATQHGKFLLLCSTNFQDQQFRNFVNGHPRSCNLTLLDFFLWSYVKNCVYVNNP